MSRDNRIKILNRIAQDLLSKSSVSGSPRSFNIVSLYPTTVLGLTSKNISPLTKLADLLNNALYYLSDGEKDLEWMRTVNFSFDASIASGDLKNVMLFCKLFHTNLLTNLGADFTEALPATEIANRIRILSTSAPLINLSSTSITGQLNLKIGGNLKSLITQTLTQIK